MKRCIFQNVIILFCSILFTIVFLEAISDFFDPDPTRAYGFPPFYFKNDPQAGFDIFENFPPTTMIFADGQYKVWSNEIGCFDYPYKGEKNYILLAGDSTAWGFAPFQYKFGTKMEEYLSRRVLKCGVAAYGTKHELLKMKKVIRQVENKPRLIVVVYSICNDLSDDYYFPLYTCIDGLIAIKVELADIKTGERSYIAEEDLIQKYKNVKIYGTTVNPKNPRIQKIKYWLVRHSRIYSIIRDNPLVRWLGRKIGLASDRPDFHPGYLLPYLPLEKYPWLLQAWDGHLNTLLEFKRLADEYNSKLLIVLSPQKEHVYDFLKASLNNMDYDLEQPGKILREFFNRHKIDSLDLTPYLRKYANQKRRKELDPQKDLYWRYDGHPNIKGNRLIALLISEYIIKQNLIEVPEKDEKLDRIKKELKEFLGLNI